MSTKIYLTGKHQNRALKNSSKSRTKWYVRNTYKPTTNRHQVVQETLTQTARTRNWTGSTTSSKRQSSRFRKKRPLRRSRPRYRLARATITNFLDFIDGPNIPPQSLKIFYTIKSQTHSQTARTRNWTGSAPSSTRPRKKRPLRRSRPRYRLARATTSQTF